jgi:hypothetical protein
MTGMAMKYRVRRRKTKSMAMSTVRKRTMDQRESSMKSRLRN